MIILPLRENVTLRWQFVWWQFERANVYFLTSCFVHFFTSCFPRERMSINCHLCSLRRNSRLLYQRSNEISRIQIRDTRYEITSFNYSMPFYFRAIEQKRDIENAFRPKFSLSLFFEHSLWSKHDFNVLCVASPTSELIDFQFSPVSEKSHFLHVK